MPIGWMWPLGPALVGICRSTLSMRAANQRSLLPKDTLRTTKDASSGLLRLSKIAHMRIFKIGCLYRDRIKLPLLRRVKCCSAACRYQVCFECGKRPEYSRACARTRSRRASLPQLDQIAAFVKHYRSHGAQRNGELIPRVLALARPNQRPQRHQFDEVASGGRRGCPRDGGILACT